MSSGKTNGTLSLAARRERRAFRALGVAGLTAVAALALGGCSIQPWVKPYERDHLADPIMSFDRDPVSTSYTDHVREAREGARGATGASGGGCGCN
jgi:hypothetical protein